MKKITVYSLSKELGVSPATVSKALNNSPEISAETSEKIRRAAEERGFRPRPMVSRTINICALLQTPNAAASCFSPYTVDVMQGMMDYLQENELEFSLFSDEVSRLNSGLLLRHLGRRNINGAVLINTNEDSAFYAELDANRFPYCSLLTNPGKTVHNLLTIDNTDAACRAVDYLIQTGHRNIAVIVTPSNGVTGRERLAGYKKALQQAGLPVNPAWIITAEHEQDGLEFGHRGTLELFRSRPEVTALFVMGERVALGALHALNRLGLSVPQQVSLLSCDDAPEVSYFNPPLTVMRIPNRKLGYTAARWVHKMIAGDSGREHPVEPWMRGELIIRDSTAPAAK
ncbi:MAG: LacI family DNA-binding transcriptional regulator [Kiritimatiellales bacterium]